MTARQYANDIVETDHDCLKQADKLAAIALVILTTMDVAELTVEFVPVEKPLI